MVKHFIKYVDVSANAFLGLEKKKKGNLPRKFSVVGFYFFQASGFLEPML